MGGIDSFQESWSADTAVPHSCKLADLCAASWPSNSLSLTRFPHPSGHSTASSDKSVSLLLFGNGLLLSKWLFTCAIYFVWFLKVIPHTGHRDLSPIINCTICSNSSWSRKMRHRFSRCVISLGYHRGSRTAWQTPLSGTYKDKD